MKTSPAVAVFPRKKLLVLSLLFLFWQRNNNTAKHRQNCSHIQTDFYTILPADNQRKRRCLLRNTVCSNSLSFTVSWKKKKKPQSFRDWGFHVFWDFFNCLLAERERFELSVLAYTRVPGVHLKPLGHLSKRKIRVFPQLQLSAHCPFSARHYQAGIFRRI